MNYINNFDNFINEKYQLTKDYQRFAYAIIEHCEKVIKDNIIIDKVIQQKDHYYDYPRDFILDFFPHYLEHTYIYFHEIEINENNYSDKFLYFIKNSHYNLSFDIEETKGGTFTDKTIILYLKPHQINDIVGKISSYGKFFFDQFSLRSYIDISIIVHELTHAYENYYSDNKAFKDIKKLKDKKPHLYKQDYEVYLNLSHEISARIYETLSDLEKEARNSDNFNDFLETFKINFEGWDNLTDKQQKDVIKKVYDFYSNVNNN